MLTSLIMRDKTSNGIVMINPNSINEQFTHSVTTRSRKIGSTKQNIVRNEFAIVRMVDVAQCGSTCSLSANENGRLMLSGASPEAQLVILEDLYRNAKAVITAHPATLRGVPVPFNVTGIQLTEPAVPAK